LKPTRNSQITPACGRWPLKALAKSIFYAGE
jgi:hypothetical protein